MRPNAKKDRQERRLKASRQRQVTKQPSLEVSSEPTVIVPDKSESLLSNEVSVDVNSNHPIFTEAVSQECDEVPRYSKWMLFTREEVQAAWAIALTVMTVLVWSL